MKISEFQSELLNAGYRIFSPISHPHPLQEIESHEYSFKFSRMPRCLRRGAFT